MNARTTPRSNDVDHRPRIYVASLADYNAGRLHGRWIDADQDIDAIREEVAAMLSESSEPVAEEWAIHDHQNFEGYEIPEYADLERVAEIAQLIVEHGPVFAGLLNHVDDELEAAKRYMDEGYRGEFEKLAHYAEELCEECYSDTLKTLPNFIRYHIDWDGIPHDMELGGDVFTVEVDRKVHVFDAHV